MQQFTVYNPNIANCNSKTEITLHLYENVCNSAYEVTINFKKDIMKTEVQIVQNTTCI